MIQRGITILFFLFTLFVAVPIFASETNGTINSSYKYAWGENLGWINMKPDNGGVTITDSAITGYAWSTVGGWINFSPSNGGVTNTSEGVLGGYAWSSQKGWIGMSGITINSSGRFAGTAGTQGSSASRITFSCDNCDVRTDWRPASARASQGGGGGGGGGGGAPYNPPAASPEQPSAPSPTPTEGRQPADTSSPEPPASSPSEERQPADTSPTTSEGEISKSNFIETRNEPLTINEEQAGRYVRDTDIGQIIVELPVNAVRQETTIIISTEPLGQSNSHLVAPIVNLINSVFYDVIARDANGNLDHSFPKPLAITLPVPADLQRESNLGVYWLNEENKSWVLIPDAIFSPDNDEVMFYVDHLTRFAIFATAEKETAPPASISIDLPEQFFVINFELDQGKIRSIDELTARMIFTSSSEAPTPVDLTFDILDSSGNVVHSEKDNVTVETEKVFIKKFTGVSLAPGAYTLRLTMLYNTSVKDEFTQPFEITEKGTAQGSYWWVRAFAGIAVLIILVIIVLKRRSRKS